MATSSVQNTVLPTPVAVDVVDSWSSATVGWLCEARSVIDRDGEVFDDRFAIAVAFETVYEEIFKSAVRAAANWDVAKSNLGMKTRQQYAESAMACVITTIKWLEYASVPLNRLTKTDANQQLECIRQQLWSGAKNIVLTRMKRELEEREDSEKAKYQDKKKRKFADLRVEPETIPEAVPAELDSQSLSQLTSSVMITTAQLNAGPPASRTRIVHNNPVVSASSSSISSSSSSSNSGIKRSSNVVRHRGRSSMSSGRAATTIATTQEKSKPLPVLNDSNETEQLPPLEDLHEIIY